DAPNPNPLQSLSRALPHPITVDRNLSHSFLNLPKIPLAHPTLFPEEPLLLTAYRLLPTLPLVVTSGDH
ncbi:MAG TPA: hypothetical protein VK673_07830, partial [Chthoniobacterales bacterium]|nr:hypothetical protein [Chthoniobacterales bacterium]